MRLLSLSRPAPGERRALSSTPEHRETTELIRTALAGILQGTPCPKARGLLLRIQHAGDAEHLWHLRPEAMSVLASLRGEAHARQALSRITPLFQDVLPDGLASKLRAAGAPDNPKETA